MNSRMFLHHRDAALEPQCASLTASVQSCMLDRKHRPYVFLKVDDMKFLRFAARPRGTQASFESMRVIPEQAKFVWNFSLAKENSGVALRYFAARKVEVMHREYFLVKDFLNACNFTASFFEKLEELPSIPR